MTQKLQPQAGSQLYKGTLVVMSNNIKVKLQKLCKKFYSIQEL